MSRNAFAALAAATTFACALIGHASIIEVVDWNGNDTDYLTTTANYRSSDGTTSGAAEWGDDALNDDSVRRFAFSDSTPLHPAGTYNTAARSAVFYGGVEEWRTTANSIPSTNGEQVVQNASGDYHTINDTNSVDRRAYALWLWKKADFVDGGSAADLTVGVGSTATVDIVTNTSNHFRWRVAVKDGGQWYLSSVSSVADDTLDLSAAAWALYDPAANLQANPANAGTNNANGGAANLSYLPHAFTDITAVGLYAEAAHTIGSGDRNFAWRQFSVSLNAVEVPEPASLALLALGAAAMLRRRHG